MMQILTFWTLSMVNHFTFNEQILVQIIASLRLKSNQSLRESFSIKYFYVNSRLSMYILYLVKSFLTHYSLYLCNLQLTWYRNYKVNNNLYFYYTSERSFHSKITHFSLKKPDYGHHGIAPHDPLMSHLYTSVSLSPQTWIHTTQSSLDSSQRSLSIVPSQAPIQQDLPLRLARDQIQRKILSQEVHRLCHLQERPLANRRWWTSHPCPQFCLLQGAWRWHPANWWRDGGSLSWGRFPVSVKRQR